MTNPTNTKLGYRRTSKRSGFPVGSIECWIALTILGAVTSCSGNAAIPASERPVCGENQTISGSAWAPCAALDGACTVGVLEETRGCCLAEQRPEGFGCEAGLCSSEGKCEAAPKDDRDGDGIRDQHDVLFGDARWISTGTGQVTIAATSEEVQIFVDGISVGVARGPNLSLKGTRASIRPDHQAVLLMVDSSSTAVRIPLSDDSKRLCFVNRKQVDAPGLRWNCSDVASKWVECPGKDCRVDNKFAEITLLGGGLIWWLHDHHDEQTLADPRVLDDRHTWVHGWRPCPDCPRDISLEFCNGVDDNGDGAIDEGGAALCNDGLRCTTDVCVPCTEGAIGCDCTGEECAAKARCVRTPDNSLCRTRAACAPNACGAPTFAEVPFGANVGIVGPDINGCFERRNHAFCTNTWDNCTCNGPELCNPDQARNFPVTLGCIESPRTSYPCEAAGIGDGNQCTEENCCESNPGACRVNQLLRAARPDLADLLADACGGANTTPGAGGANCVVGADQYRWAPLVPKQPGYWCDDQVPCTTDDCTPATGCRFRPIRNSRVPGCEGVTADACGTRRCVMGTCVSDANPANDNPMFSELCRGYAVEDEEDLMRQSCITRRCVNRGTTVRPQFTCVSGADDSRCSDALFCNGVETCSLAGHTFSRRLPRVSTDVPAPGPILGCVSAPAPCDDGIPCTVDQCDELARSCSVYNDDAFCHDAVGLSWRSCEAEFVCSGDCERCNRSGCERLAPGAGEGCADSGCAEATCSVSGEGRVCRGASGCCETLQHRSVNLTSLENLCPYFNASLIPGRLSTLTGDREFDGHGPEVRVEVALSVSADRKRIEAHVYYEARELLSNFSTIRYLFRPYTVYRTAGGTIEGILDGATGSASGISAPGTFPGLACGGCGIVDFTRISGVISGAQAVGDTTHTDISDSPSCGDETFLRRLDFRPLRIALTNDCPI